MNKKIFTKLAVPITSIVSYFILQKFGSIPLFTNDSWNTNSSIVIYSSLVTLFFYVIGLLFKLLSLHSILEVHSVTNKNTSQINMDFSIPKRIEITIKFSDQYFNHHNFLKNIEVSFPTWITVMPKSTTEIIPSTKKANLYSINLLSMNANDKCAKHAFDIMVNEEFKVSSREGLIKVRPIGFRFLVFTQKIPLSVKYISKKGI